MAINTARDSYKVERWWKYGQPAIDRIAGVLNVTDPHAAGEVIGRLANMHSGELQVRLDVFPYGIPVIDGVRVHVNLDQKVG